MRHLVLSHLYFAEFSYKGTEDAKSSLSVLVVSTNVEIGLTKCGFEIIISLNIFRFSVLKKSR